MTAIVYAKKYDNNLLCDYEVNYEILSARIEMFDNSNTDLNVVGTMNVDVSKIM